MLTLDHVLVFLICLGLISHWIPFFKMEQMYNWDFDSLPPFPGFYCTVSGFKLHHQCRMAAPIPRLQWLHVYIIGERSDVFYAFIPEKTRML